MVMRSKIVGCGAYLPERVITNAELAEQVDTTDAWIIERTGILKRHVAAAGELTSDLATQAAKQALTAAGLTAVALDLIILATATPDHTLPATAAKVQSRLGMERGAAFDIQAVCSGFIYALTVADQFIRTAQAQTVLVIGAETFSRLLDWTDRNTCILFGDGAGAVVLQAEPGVGNSQDHGILSAHIHTDGRYYDLLYVDGGPSSGPATGFLRMIGKDVFRYAIVHLANVVNEALAANHLTLSDIDWLVPHQANRRILDGTARKLGLPAEKVIVTVEHHANTSAASIPLALSEALADNRIRPGHLVLLEAMGGGLTWGACLVRM
ncbi:3-oxoacyl-[acyl-carrier-protein] synthase, KASIII [invertebrate metagenome]|uniref:beta-ketoacyl-[acyl-carrier-protein] synthase III n=1 Tax=invertebrate metagenome TaxID=1711999 RepID=A0A484H6G6_9ZZZZ